MSKPDSVKTSSSPSNPKGAVRAVLVYLLVAVPLVAGWFLFSADLFDAYHGTAACHRPLPRSDGADDRVMRFVLARPSLEDLELVLPTEAFAGYELPRCSNGIPPRKLSEEAPAVHKDAFTLSFTVNERAWPTPTPVDLFFPILLACLGLPLRNYLVTGSPVHFTGKHVPPPVLRTKQRKSGRSTGTPGKGPPPSHLRKGGRRRRRR